VIAEDGDAYAVVCGGGFLDGGGEGEGVISCASEERRVARRRKMERSVMGRGTIRARGG
jgi:hypothetical protein